MKGFIRDLFRQDTMSQVNPLWMVCLRCGIALIALLHFLALQQDFDSIFSATAFVPPDIAAGTRNFLLPTIYTLYKSLNTVVPLTYGTLLMVIRILYPLALLMLLAGSFTRCAAILSLALQLLIVNSMEFYSYGVDVFTAIALFYCCVFPVGSEFSLDKLWFIKQVSPERSAKCLRVFQTHVCIIYFFSGFEKLLGYNWRNGESIWRMVHGYNATETINVDFLFNTPVFLILGWLTIIVEMLYPVFINIPKTQKLWLWSTIAFHAGIAFFMGLYFFSAVMVILNIAAYYIPFVKEERVTKKNKALAIA